MNVIYYIVLLCCHILFGSCHAVCMHTRAIRATIKSASAQSSNAQLATACLEMTNRKEVDYLASIIPDPEIQLLIKQYYIDLAEYVFAMYSLTTLPEAADGIRSPVALSPDGKMVATGHVSGDVKIWYDTQCKIILHQQHGSIVDIAIARDGALAARAAQGQATLWNNDFSIVRFSPGLVPHGRNSMVMAADGTIATTTHCTKSNHCVVSVWKHGVLDNLLSESTLAYVDALAIGQDGIVIAKSGKYIYVWEPLKPTLMFRDDLPSTDFLRGIAAGCRGEITIGTMVIKRGELVAFLDEGPEVFTPPEQQHISENVVATTMNRDMAVTASNTGTAKIWKNRRCIATLPLGTIELGMLHTTSTWSDNPKFLYRSITVALADDGTVLTRNRYGVTRIWRPTPECTDALYALSIEQLIILRTLFVQLEALRAKISSGELQLDLHQNQLVMQLPLTGVLERNLSSFFRTDFKQIIDKWNLKKQKERIALCGDYQILTPEESKSNSSCCEQ